jgi:hypothetical protein
VVETVPEDAERIKQLEKEELSSGTCLAHRNVPHSDDRHSCD